jgi:hypothetical protein
MSDVPLPAMLDDFDLEAEIAEMKTRIPLESNGQWTDVAESDPGITLARLVLEKIGERLYSASARYAPDELLLAISAKLLGIPLLDPQPARGDIELVLEPGTNLAAGYLVLLERSGVQYKLLAAASSPAGGAVPASVEATINGTIGNAERSEPMQAVQQPSVGGVIRISNTTAFTGGSDGETLEQYRKRLPQAMANTVLDKSGEYAARASENAGIAQAREFRNTRPSSSEGYFEQRDGHVTLVCVSSAGGAPSNAALIAIRDSILADTWLNMRSSDPTRPFLHVLPARLRLVGVTAQLVLEYGSDPEAAKAQAKSAVTAWLDPISGGRQARGHAIGRRPAESELYAVLQGLGAGIQYIEDDSLRLTNAAPFAVDEIVNADLNGITFTHRFEAAP